MTSVVGLLLAAGAGRRMGAPKALVCDPDGTSWLIRSVTALVEGGCDQVTVVLGAEHDRAATLLADSGVTVDVVVAEDWDEGMGASLRAGLRRLLTTEADAAMVSLVDLPDVGADVVSRVLAAPMRARSLTAVLARAAYDGVPGHPVLLGRDHWVGVIDAATGDSGARGYLSSHGLTLVECGDLATGQDVDFTDLAVGRTDHG